MPIISVVEAWKKVSPNLQQGWHTATVTFELDAQGELMRVDEIKVCSLGDTLPTPIPHIHWNSDKHAFDPD